MNSSFTYPIVSYTDIIDLFHSILFWRHKQQVASGIGYHHRYTSFNPMWAILEMNNILPKQRIARLRGNQKFCKLFLQHTLVIEEWDERDWQTILERGGIQPFCVRKGNRELVAGNVVNYLELCTRTRIYITRLGVRMAPAAVERIAHLLSHEQFLAAWERYTAPPKNKASFLKMIKMRNAKLNEEIWGERKDEDGLD